MWATVRSLTKNEQLWANRSPKNEQLWANHSSKMRKLANHSFFWMNCSFALFSQKTSDLQKKPMSKFPTLGTTNNMHFLQTQNQSTLLNKGVCYCTNLAYNKSTCTWSTAVPSHIEIIPIIEQTMIYKFHSLLLFTGNVAKHKSKLKVVLFCKIHMTTPLSNLSSE